MIEKFFLSEMDTLLSHFDETTVAILTGDEEVQSCLIHYREILEEMEEANDKIRSQIDDFQLKTNALRKEKL